MLSKKEQNDLTREMLFQKFSGKCAFCGDLLPKKWHIWRIDPVSTIVSGNGELIHGNDSYENKLPACISCNATRIHNSADKHMKIDIESFRQALRNDHAFLKTNTYYQKAFRYGLITETGKDVEFYFEQQLSKPL